MVFGVFFVLEIGGDWLGLVGWGNLQKGIKVGCCLSEQTKIGCVLGG